MCTTVYSEHVLINNVLKFATSHWFGNSGSHMFLTLDQRVLLCRYRNPFSSHVILPA